MNLKKKIVWIDVLKAIGIILVVIGHNDTILTKYIYSFHMPLFFFLSGLTFDSEKWMDIRAFIKSRIRSLLIPYFKYSTILFIIWIPLDIIKGVEINKNIIVRNFYGIFYSQGSLKYMAWGVPMWFLTCLFFTSIIYFFINKYFKNNKINILLLSAIIGYLTKYFNFRLFWSLDSAFTAVVFYGIGHTYKEYFLRYKFDVKSNYNKFKFLSFIIIFIFLNNLNGRVDFYSNQFNNYIIFYICSFIGIMILLIIAKSIKNENLINKLSFLSKNNIIILAFHIRILDSIKFFVVKILKLNLDFNNFILGVIILPIIQILSICFIILIVNKFKTFKFNKSVNENLNKKSFTKKGVSNG